MNKTNAVIERCAPLLPPSEEGTTFLSSGFDGRISPSDFSEIRKVLYRIEFPSLNRPLPRIPLFDQTEESGSFQKQVDERGLIVSRLDVLHRKEETFTGKKISRTGGQTGFIRMELLILQAGGQRRFSVFIPRALFSLKPHQLQRIAKRALETILMDEPKNPLTTSLLIDSSKLFRYDEDQYSPRKKRNSISLSRGNSDCHLICKDRIRWLESLVSGDDDEDFSFPPILIQQRTSRDSQNSMPSGSCQDSQGLGEPDDEAMREGQGRGFVVIDARSLEKTVVHFFQSPVTQSERRTRGQSSAAHLYSEVSSRYLCERSSKHQTKKEGYVEVSIKEMKKRKGLKNSVDVFAYVIDHLNRSRLGSIGKNGYKREDGTWFIQEDFLAELIGKMKSSEKKKPMRF